MNSERYKQQILELYKNPENFGEIKNPTYSYTETSPTCGDEIKIELKVKNNKIEDAKFYGSGCVISVVSSSLLTKKIKGMSLLNVKKISDKDVLNYLGIKLTPARINCALVPHRALIKSLNKK